MKHDSLSLCLKLGLPHSAAASGNTNAAAAAASSAAAAVRILFNLDCSYQCQKV